MVICTKKTEISLTVFTWSGSSKERERWKKAKILNELEMRESFSPLSVLRLYQISSIKTKKICVFGVKVSSTRTTNSSIRSRSGLASVGNHMISSTS